MPLNSKNANNYLVKGELYQLIFENGSCSCIHSVIADVNNYALRVDIITQSLNLFYLGEKAIKWKYCKSPLQMHKFLHKDILYCFRLSDLCKGSKSYNKLKLVKLT